MSPIEGHTVWDHNKMWIGTYGEAYITINGSEVQGKGTTQDDNHRGPFTNHRDYEWKFTGSVDKWAYTGYPSNISPLSLYSM
ncbi:1031_t:CDS:2 [Rhizophagus irregularis]|nr:1031_t:CDS:2 [Rhizophagus irregularis]